VKNVRRWCDCAEISRVRGSVLSFSGDSDALELPEPVGPTVTLSEKLTIPVKEHPEVKAQRPSSLLMDT